MSQKVLVALKIRMSPQAKSGVYRDEFHPPPVCVTERCAGRAVQVPDFPLCCLGLTREEVNALYCSPGSANWWGAKFQMGRAPFDTRYCAVRHALFESFAPVERALAPIYRFLIRTRVATLRGDTAPDSSDVRTMAFETALSTLNLGASSLELEALLRAYIHDIPEFVVSIIGQSGELVGPSGRLEPLGVLAGMVFALVARASYGARLQWFQALDWWKVSRMLRGLTPSSKEAKAPLKGRIGFDDLVYKDASERMRGLIPVQPDDKSRE